MTKVTTIQPATSSILVLDVKDLTGETTGITTITITSTSPEHLAQVTEAIKLRFQEPKAEEDTMACVEKAVVAHNALETMH